MDIITHLLKGIEDIGNKDLFIGSLLADLYLKYDKDEIDTMVSKAVGISNNRVEELLCQIERNIRNG